MNNVGQDTTNSYVSATSRVTSKLHKYFRNGEFETAATWNSPMVFLTPSAQN